MLWGTGTTPAAMSVEHRGKILQSFWTEKNATHPARAGEGRDAAGSPCASRNCESRVPRPGIAVPWTNKNLTVKWERFINKSSPARRLSAVITGPTRRRSRRWWRGCTTRRSTPTCRTTGWAVRRVPSTTRTWVWARTCRVVPHIHGHWPVSHKGGPDVPRVPDEITFNWQRHTSISARAAATAAGTTAAGAIAAFRRRHSRSGVMRRHTRGRRAGQRAKKTRTGCSADRGSGRAAERRSAWQPAAPARTSARFRRAEPQREPRSSSAPDQRRGRHRSRAILDETLTKLSSSASPTTEPPQRLHHRQRRLAKDLMAQPTRRGSCEGDVIEFTVRCRPERDTAKGMRLTFKTLHRQASVPLGLANADQAFDLAAGESRRELEDHRTRSGRSSQGRCRDHRLSDGEAAIGPIEACW